MQPTDLERANTRHLYFEMLFMAVAFAMDWYFLGVFAIRLGATPLQLGALSSLRALMLAVGSGASSRWQGRFVNVIQAIQFPMFIYRVFVYLLIAFVPFLPDCKVDVLVALVAISALPHGATQGVFLNMMRAAVSEQHLARVVSQRMVIMNVAILFCVIIFGQLLERIAFPVNYQIGFLIAFAASLLSWWHVRQIKVPNRVVAAPSSQAAVLPVKVWKHPVFLRFAVIVVAINVSVFMAAPLVQLHLIRSLNASDTWISVFGLCEMAAGALITLRMDWLIARFKTTGMITALTFFTFAQTLTLGLIATLPPFIGAQLFFGAGWFGLGVVLYNRLVEVAPHENFAPYAATYQMLINASLFVGPLIGTFLIENGMTLPAALMIVAACRFAAGVVTWAVPRRPVRSAIEAVKSA
ncbi:MAG: hypothetical protein IT324_05690 [Anaerolineae bacterium]|nr:hypothetical protein [Anaerolineae bacterium]